MLLFLSQVEDFLLPFINTINIHLEWVPYFPVCYSLKFSYNPQINTHGVFTVTHAHVQTAKSLSHAGHRFSAGSEQGSALPSCFGPDTISKCPFHGLFNAMFSAFVYSCLWFCWSKWSLNKVLECWLVFLNARRLWCSLWRIQISCISFLQAWDI